MGEYQVQALPAWHTASLEEKRTSVKDPMNECVVQNMENAKKERYTRRSGVKCALDLAWEPQEAEGNEQLQ